MSRKLRAEIADLASRVGTVESVPIASSGEILDGSETNVRRLSPALVKLSAETHGSGAAVTASLRQSVVAANSFSNGQPVYRNGSTWALAKADNAATCADVWYVENATPAGFDLVRGKVSVPAGLGLSPGIHYISAATAGLFTATAPTASPSNVIVPCLTVYSDNTGTFWPPSFPSSNEPLSLTADVTGVLPVANGGTGTATPGLVAGSNVTISGTWPNQTISANSSGGSSRVFGGTNASAVVTNTNTATTLVSGTVPGGTLGTTGAVKLEIRGAIFNDSGAAQGATITVKFGATTLWSDALPTTAIANNSALRPYEIEVILAAMGATNSQRIAGSIVIGQVPATTGIGDQAAAVSHTKHPFGGSSAEDSTADKTLTVEITPTNASANYSWYAYVHVARSI